MSFIGFFRKILCVIITTVLFLFSGVTQTPGHTVLDEENCLLCVQVFSDCHIEGNNFARYKVLRSLFNDANKNTFGNDAVVFLGDNTMNGQNIESLLFYGMLAGSNVSANKIIVCGNHDVGNGNGDYKKLCERFLDYNNSVLGLGIEKPYYYKVVDGYYFITLAPEELCVSEFPISDEQYEFLDAALAKAASSGKPAFVCAHFPWYYPDDDGERLAGILTKYENVFYLSGHTHMPCFEGWTFNCDDGINEINLPRCTELAGSGDDEIYKGTGWAVQLEVYENEVVGRVRNYYTGEWDSALEYHFCC